MIEVIYKEEKQEAKGTEDLFSIPRNIRQIGLVGQDYKIYIEDYVYTFLGRLAGAEEEKEGGSLAVLTGDTKWKSGATYLFIRGALMVEDAQAAPEHIDFSDEIWARIHEDQEKFFPGQEIVGWFFAAAQLPMEATEIFAKVHLRYFGGEKVLMLMEPIEREDAFFCYENGLMAKQRGYYIYYEKNPLMQEYMIGKNDKLTPQPTENVEDEAVKSFRKIIGNKNSEKTEEKPQETEEGHASVFSYAATACLVIAVLAVGANFYRNYQETDRTEEPQTILTSADGAGEITVSVSPIPTEPRLTAGGATVTPLPDTDEDGGEELEEETAGLGVYPVESDERKALRQNTATGQENGQETSTFADWNSQAEEQGQSDTQSESQENGGQEQINGQSQENSGQGQTNSGQSQGNSGQNQAQDSGQEETADGTANRNAAGQTGADSQSQTTSVSSGEVHETYVIRPGDTLYEISLARYGTVEAITEICRLNDLKENQIIYPGQVIVLP